MEQSKGRYCFDIETTGLLDDSTVDYTASPWKMRDGYKIHCIVAIDLDTKEVFEWVQEECYTKFRPWVKENVSTIVAHNQINFDLMVLQAVLGMEYTLGFEDKPSTWDGKPVTICDTFVLSKVLWPDRPAHSIEYFGSILGEEKIDWRAKAVELGLIEWNAPKGAEFAVYHPEMLVYNRRDVTVNIRAYNYLMKEWGDWDWSGAFELEQYVAWVIARQSHRGFWFDKELAIKNVEELDGLMAHHRAIVEPHLPPKPMGKTKLKEFTPPAIQFKKNGETSANIGKWAEKHGATLEQREDGWWAIGLYGKDWKLPITEPVKTHEPASISDSTFIKGFLVEQGWNPTNVKEKDLTLDSKKKKLTKEKYAETVDRYVEQTLNSPFCEIRLEKLGATRNNLKDKLLKHDLAKPLKVLTNPTFTVGQEKQIDPELEALNGSFPYVQNIVEYLTYNHRRNSILGGGFDVEDEDEAETGFLPNVRQDGRIPTPADTNGAATGRMKHRLVCNIPRVTSLYGEPIRKLFGVGDGKDFVQFAFDFASLEAMIESHYCWRYDVSEDKEYCNSLIQEKPNDVHTKTASKIAEMIGQSFSRGNAKSVKYACVPMDTQALTRNGWKYYHELNIGDEVLGYNKKTGYKEWTTIRNLITKEDEVVSLTNKWTNLRATNDHRWYIMQRRTTGKGNTCYRKFEMGVRTTAELNSESNIIGNAPMNPEQDVINSEFNWTKAEKYKTDWVEAVLNMSQKQREAFLAGFMIADGYCSENGTWNWAQNEGNLAEAALLATYLTHDGLVQVRPQKGANGKVMMNTLLSRRNYRPCQTLKRSSLGVQQVWCMTTDLGSWVMRQGNTITITGNCAYGAQAPKVAKTVGCSVMIGERIFNAYWDAAAPLAALKDALTKYWETKGGKKFILGIDGRKIMTRSKHSLVNALFQGAGVTCAKRSMVYQDVEFRKRNISVDFWLEDWKNKPYIQQLIAYHK